MDKHSWDEESKGLQEMVIQNYHWMRTTGLDRAVLGYIDKFKQKHH
jgi:hypothetical protein